MKAKKYISGMLVVLIFATVSIQAQTARRPSNQDNRQGVRTASTYKRESKSVKVTNEQTVKNRKVQTQQSYRKQPAGASQSQQLRKPVSMTTTKNPGSNYRKPVNKVTTGVRYNTPVRSKTYYTNRAYYGGNHYHYAYPTSKVRFNYHHNTYVNNYRVLYYPTYADIYWTRNMYRDYHRWYPGYSWNYSYGYRIQTISAFDAKYYLGEVALVYGRVYATWYNKETDDYLLFFGGDFPYQEFTVVVPGHVARKFSWRPERYFLGEHVTINGLITTFDGSPEIVVKDRRQVALY